MFGLEQRDYYYEHTPFLYPKGPPFFEFYPPDHVYRARFAEMHKDDDENLAFWKREGEFLERAEFHA